MDDNQNSKNDALFDYEIKAKAVRKTQQYLHGCSLEDLSDPLFGATQEDRVRIWREALDEAYPPGFWEAFNHLRDKNSAGLPMAIEFLEADPWFFRTGYIKERLIRYVIQFNPLHDYTQRLQSIVLNAVDKRYRREFRAYCRLARKVDDPEFRHALCERMIQPNPDIRRRAQWVLDGLENGVQKKGKHRRASTTRRNAPLSSAFLAGIERFRSGNPDLLEDVMNILESASSGWFNHAGKAKCEIARALVELDLSLDLKLRLQSIILSIVDTYYVYGFEHYAKLASRINTPEFHHNLEERLEDQDFHVRRRAQLVLNEIEKNGGQ